MHDRDSGSLQLPTLIQTAFYAEHMISNGLVLTHRAKHTRSVHACQPRFRHIKRPAFFLPVINVIGFAYRVRVHLVNIRAQGIQMAAYTLPQRQTFGNRPSAGIFQPGQIPAVHAIPVHPHIGIHENIPDRFPSGRDFIDIGSNRPCRTKLCAEGAKHFLPASRADTAVFQPAFMYGARILRLRQQSDSLRHLPGKSSRPLLTEIPPGRSKNTRFIFHLNRYNGFSFFIIIFQNLHQLTESFRIFFQIIPAVRGKHRGFRAVLTPHPRKTFPILLHPGRRVFHLPVFPGAEP